MNKFLVVSIVVVSFTVSLRADSTRKRYLVATERPFREDKLPKGSYTRFSAVDGYAVELTEQEAQELAATSGVRHVEPDVERFVYATASPRIDVSQMTPWGVSAVNASAVRFLTRGENVRVGIIDTGIDLRHPDLQAAYRGGWDFVHDDDVPEEEAQGDGFGHGTRMAGILAGSDNGFGVVGAAPGVSLFVLKIFPKSGGALTSNVIHAVDWAIANKLDVVSCSFGGDKPSKLEEEAYARARRANVLVIAAVGNHASYVRYPAAYPSVVGVGAIDRTNRIAGFSNTGAEVDFVAPGVDVMSTMITGAGRVGSITLEDGSVLTAQPLAYSKFGAVAGVPVDCAYGGPAEFPAAAAGNIALVQRDAGQLSAQATNAIAAHAGALVLVNSAIEDWPLRGSLGRANPRWPVTVGVSMESGRIIRERGGSVVVDSYVTDYDASDGASISAPYVAAVAALMRALRPELSADEVVALLASTATDLGAAGRDPIYGYGLVNAYTAAAAAVPERMSGKKRRRAVGH